MTLVAWGFLVRAAVLAAGSIAAACSPSGDAPGPAAAAATPSPGRLVYLAEPCPTCHGHGREGTNTGPALHGLRAHWDEDTLARFLHQPVAFKLADPRLATLASRYKSDMPALFADPARVSALARYLLFE
ncbi:MAG: c-type cytochrome [Acidobacteria bacterium]|nr:MAG: c-type cytochrome [Acidobacteriota bacterium]